MQVWKEKDQPFVYFFTLYSEDGRRQTYFSVSNEGVEWSPRIRLAAIGKGHYHISGLHRNKAGTAFNYHPIETGLNSRTNLYYMETRDFGRSWLAADGTQLQTPLTEPENAALVHNYEKEALLVYMKDLTFDAIGRPAILFLTSRSFEPGPGSGPRVWRTAFWTGSRWNIHQVAASDNNYDMGSLYLEPNGIWRVIAPTERGAQTFNPGGEVSMWLSRNQGRTWRKEKDLTADTPLNHSYVRRPVNAHPDFYAFWADGHGRFPSQSRLYFCNKKGEVFVLPHLMKNLSEKPLRLATELAPPK
jgi:hypothetical protein